MNRFMFILTSAALSFLLTGYSQATENTAAGSDLPVAEAEGVFSEAKSTSESQSVDTASNTDFLNDLGVMDEPYTMTAYTPQQGVDGDGLYPYPGWDEGTMIMTIHSAKVTDYDISGYSDESSLENLSRNASQCDDPCMVVINLTLENIDATHRAGAQYEFYANMFQLAAAEDYLPKNQNAGTYTPVGWRHGEGGFSPVFDQHGEGSNYNHFTLNAGSSMETSLIFVVDREYLNEDTPILAVATARARVLGVVLDKLEQ